MTPDDPRHGTYAGYNVPCRCEACVTAYNRYHRHLRYDHDRGLTRTVPSIGFRRRVQALQALGWPLSVIAAEMGGCDKRNVKQSCDSERVYRSKLQRLVEVYDRLSMRLGPSVRSRNLAQRNGWLPPLAWTNIDDPNERPTRGRDHDDDVDPILVERILAGDILTANRAERCEVIRRWPSTGLPLNELQRRFPQWNLWRDMKQMEAA